MYVMRSFAGSMVTNRTKEQREIRMNENVGKHTDRTIRAHTYTNTHEKQPERQKLPGTELQGGNEEDTKKHRITASGMAKLNGD